MINEFYNIAKTQNQIEATDEFLAAWEKALEADEASQGGEEDFDYSTLFDGLSPEEVEEAENEAKENEAREIRERFEAANLVYDASKNYVDCPKCNGVGVLDCYYYVSNGVCFKCGGAGKVAK